MSPVVALNSMLVALDQYVSASLELHVVLEVVVVAQQNVLLLQTISSIQLPEMNYAVNS